ncbi:MAG: hypothetical protein CMLOHMNK_02525 [Steroidobacteraceae bacterium]|nr:hypothetical protein [Steroidobacteraceae bacterium]
MSQADPIRVFVSHVWATDDDYLRVFEYLESARNFFYRNTSTPDHVPAGDKEALREDLRRQIREAEVVILLPALYAKHQDLVTFQARFAQASSKPVVLLKYFGKDVQLPKELASLANAVVDWDERGLVDAIRKEARHENTARWDVIEFKLD